MKKNFLLTFVLVVAIMSVSLFAQEVDRTKPPQLPVPKALTVAPIQQFTLSSGLKVYLMEKHEVPLVQLNIIVKVGSVNDPAEKVGLTNLALDMMDEGAAGKTALELADEIDFLGARIQTSSSLYTSGIYLHTPLSKFDDALKIVGNILLHPDFPKAELDRKKKDRLTSLMQAHDQPTQIASAAFNSLLFGKEHPFGRNASEKSIKSFSIDDLKSVHQKYFVANNAFVVCVGDVKPAELKSKLEKVFGKWQKGNVTETKVAETPQVAKRVVYLVDKPGAAQSVIYIGRVGVERLTKDYNALVVMNTILGGSFTSRLNNNLREVHGYTYGASSRFTFRPIPGSFYASSSVQTEVTDKALTEFFNEFKGIREPFTNEDLNRGKNLVALSYPGNFQNASQIASQIEELVYYNLPNNYFNNYVSSMLNVKAEDVNTVAKKYIVPEQMLVVVVGDKAKVEEGIKALNLGELKNLTIDDVLGKVPQLDQ